MLDVVQGRDRTTDRLLERGPALRVRWGEHVLWGEQVQDQAPLVRVVRERVTDHEVDERGVDATKPAGRHPESEHVQLLQLLQRRQMVVHPRFEVVLLVQVLVRRMGVMQQDRPHHVVTQPLGGVRDRLLLEREREEDEVDAHLDRRTALRAVVVHLLDRLVGFLGAHPGLTHVRERSGHPLRRVEPKDPDLREPTTGRFQIVRVEHALRSEPELVLVHVEHVAPTDLLQGLLDPGR